MAGMAAADEASNAKDLFFEKNTFIDVDDYDAVKVARELRRTKSESDLCSSSGTISDGHGSLVVPEELQQQQRVVSLRMYRRHDPARYQSDGASSSDSFDGSTPSTTETSQDPPPGVLPGKQAQGQSQKHAQNSVPWSESKGSAQHEEGQCTPCLWVRSKVGCKTGASCLFCHLEHRKQGRKRPVKSKRIRMKEQLSEMVDACDQNPEKLEQAVETVVAVDKNYMNAITKNKIEELKEQGRQQQQCEEVMNPVPQDRAPGCVSISGTKLKL
eukprot:gnl/TRDRNA2_/TRDRNA2_170577_c1_seq6.p1 gnl/TRDRNA2_/TRDRNA2_170577_c1~~gnl/TRDRNA2_/TRDRNA2_170577_c1_seq6.p1  ORF type:complete len:283 (-),score=53.91 gnl/TRDRNA2_/TRDRNA2_170577_c1_seq6:93-905(-)